jgi:glycosyltransferase involved in cell wall biosynthesis
MKIGFILSNGVILKSNGIVSQALTWKKGLEKLGIDVTLINMWDKNDWKQYDIIHFFGISNYMSDFITNIYTINSNIVVSPILDPKYSIFQFKLYSKIGSKILNLSNTYYNFISIKDKIKCILVRSHFEYNYLVKSFSFSPSVCNIIPISYDLPFNQSNINKEPFCLHVSILMDERKNVKRLIQAAIKYKFKLVLAGTVRNDKELATLNSWIGNNSNIQYLGFLSNIDLVDLYSRATVFALPSTKEGVGIVALEAASFGCDIVITNIGGPKEYYNNLAKEINPYNIDDIGIAIIEFLSGDTYQPKLGEYVRNKFSVLNVSKQLLSIYQNILIK